MLTQVTRVAERAWRTVEDKLDDANLAQAVICAGVATEKMLLLADQPTARRALDITPMNLVTSFQATTVKLVELAKRLPEVCKPDAIEVEAKVAAP